MSYAVYILVPDVSKSRNLRNVGNKITMQRYNLFNPAVFVFLRDSPQWAMTSSFTRFLDHTQDAPQFVGLLWTSDQLVAETSI